MIPQVFLDFYSRDFKRTSSYWTFPHDLYELMMVNFVPKNNYTVNDELPMTFYANFLLKANTPSFRNFCTKNNINLFSQLEIQIWLFLNEEGLFNDQSLSIGQLSEDEKSSMLNALTTLKSNNQLNSINLDYLLSRSGGNFFENKAAILLFSQISESGVINYAAALLQLKSRYFSVDDLLAFAVTPNFNIESLNQLTNLIFENLLKCHSFKTSICNNTSVDKSAYSNQIKDNLKQIKGDLNQYLIVMQHFIPLISPKLKIDQQLFLATQSLNEFYDMSFDYNDALILHIFMCTCSANEKIRACFPVISKHEKRGDIIKALDFLIKIQGYKELCDVEKLINNLLINSDPYTLVTNVIRFGEKKFADVLYSAIQNVDLIGEIIYVLKTNSKIKFTSDNLAKITTAVRGQPKEIIFCILRLLEKLIEYKMLTQETFVKWIKMDSNKRLEICSLVDLIFVDPRSITYDIHAASNKRIGIFTPADWQDRKDTLTLEILNVLLDNYIRIDDFKQNNFVEWLLYARMFTPNNLKLLLNSAKILAQVSYNYSELTDELRCNILQRIMFYLSDFAQDPEVVDVINSMITVLSKQSESSESEFNDQPDLSDGIESLITLPEGYGIQETFKLVTPAPQAVCVIPKASIQDPLFVELYKHLQKIQNDSYLYGGAAKLNLNNFVERFTKVMTLLSEGEQYAEILEELHQPCLYKFFEVYNLPPRKDVVKFFGTLYVQLWQASEKTLTHIELTQLVKICEENNNHIKDAVLQLLRGNALDNLYLPYLSNHPNPTILVESLILLNHEVENSSCVKVYLDNLVTLQTADQCINFMKAIVFLDATDWFTDAGGLFIDNCKSLITKIETVSELLSVMKRMQIFNVLTQNRFTDLMLSPGMRELDVDVFGLSSSITASEIKSSENIPDGVELKEGKKNIISMKF